MIWRKAPALATYENAAFIHVIPKPEKDHGDCANYRPILLINVDLKLMTKVLANQINTFRARTIQTRWGLYLTIGLPIRPDD